MKKRGPPTFVLVGRSVGANSPMPFKRKMRSNLALSSLRILKESIECRVAAFLGCSFVCSGRPVGCLSQSSIRISFCTLAFFSSKHRGEGSFYLITFNDKDGHGLEGSAAIPRLDLDFLARGGWSLTLHPMQNHGNAGREAHVRTPRGIRSIRRGPNRRA